MPCAVRLFHQRDLVITTVEEDRYVLKHIARRIGHASHCEVLSGDTSRHGAAEVLRNSLKELPDRFVPGQLLIELIEQSLQALLVGAQIRSRQEGPYRTVRALHH